MNHPKWGKWRKEYKFTNKRHPPKAVMAVILGVISMVYLGLCVYYSFLSAGAATEGYGLVGLLSAIFALTGLILSITARGEPDRYPLFPYLGIFVNLMVLCCISVILYAGAYGI